MTCANCGIGKVYPVDVDEPSDEGKFSEVHECDCCGAKGYVHGREEQHADQWDRFGKAFEEQSA